MNWFGLVFLLVWGAGITVAIARLQLRRRRNHPLKAWVQGQPVTFSTKAKVRKRANGGVGWVDFKSPSGVQLLIRDRGIEVSLAPPMDRIISTAEFLRADETTISLDRIGWSGSPVARHDCIRLDGIDLNGRVELAVSPVTSSIQDAWNALLQAGSKPRTSEPPAQ